MAFDNPKPFRFPSGHVIPKGESLNRILDATLRQVRGGGTNSVIEMGDRVVINGEGDYPHHQDVRDNVMTFAVREVMDDYLKCVPYNPPIDGTTKRWKNSTLDSSIGQIKEPFGFVYVALPWELRRSTYDGVTVTYNDNDFTYTHVASGVRTISVNDEWVLTEKLGSIYGKGDIVHAVFGATGLQSPPRTFGAAAPDISWTDLNLAAHAWELDEYQHFATINDTRKDNNGRVRATLLSFVDTHADDGEIIRVEGINIDDWAVNRHYPVWPTSKVCRPPVGDAPACPQGAPTPIPLTVSGMPTGYTGLNGTFSLIYQGAGVWKDAANKWTLTLTSGTKTLVGVTGGNTVTYTASPAITDCLVALTFGYTSNSTGASGATFPAVLTTGLGEACGDPDAEPLWGDPPAYRVWLADPQGVDGYTGNRVVLINWQCISNVPTLTFETWHFVNGRLISVS